jgi:5-methyltetrahydrofolate--homocysteine methyltransferase
LPARDAINGTFFALALENQLSASIMNPYSVDMMKTYYAYCALKGLDPNCAAYIGAAESFAVVAAAPMAEQSTSGVSSAYASELQRAIGKGLHEKASELTQKLLASVPPMEIVQNEIIPALDSVGKGFENKTVYLPQLLMSAEAAKAAFEEIKTYMTASGGQSVRKGQFVLATVHGDIHDIGKNIVRLLLENYGFEVTDLGKDVPPEVIVRTVVERKAHLVGLSALMTTTVPAMEKTVKLLRELAPNVKVMVGGAVITEEYASMIGADFYAPDAMGAVRIAESI